MNEQKNPLKNSKLTSTLFYFLMKVEVYFTFPSNHCVLSDIRCHEFTINKNEVTIGIDSINLGFFFDSLLINGGYLIHCFFETFLNSTSLNIAHDLPALIPC
jgi:hypothetical protein